MLVRKLDGNGKSIYFVRKVYKEAEHSQANGKVEFANKFMVGAATRGTYVLILILVPLNFSKYHQLYILFEFLMFI